MSRLRIEEVVVVEGRYDAATLSTLIDALIITTDGFSIFTDDEKKALLRELGQKRGLLLLTDSDAAGFAIRRYVESVAHGCEIKHAYIPAVKGKEGRKQAPSKEGTLGVEGLPPEVLREALARAGVTAAAPREGRAITYTDLYELGLSGGAGSAVHRRAVLERLGLPPRLSKKALLGVLSTLYSHEEFTAAIRPKPPLYWLPEALLAADGKTLRPEAIPTLRELQRRGYQSYVLPGARVPKQALAPYICGFAETAESPHATLEGILDVYK